jgi:hypothetical protein
MKLFKIDHLRFVAAGADYGHMFNDANSTLPR